MRVEVRLFATLERYLPADADGDRVMLDLPEHGTVADAMARLRVPTDLPVLAVVNGLEADRDTRLRTGDVVAMFPPLAGGSMPEGPPRLDGGGRCRPSA